MPCTIWYHLNNFKNVKNTHGRVLLLVKLLAKACKFTKSITPPWMFFTFFLNCTNGTKLRKASHILNVHEIVRISSGYIMNVQYTSYVQGDFDLK